VITSRDNETLKLVRKLLGQRKHREETGLFAVEGEDLVAAAREAGAPKFIAQSFAPLRYAHVGGPVKDESDPLITDPPASARQMFAAMAHVDQAVTAAGGIALRYGAFYGAANDGTIEPVRKRQFPIVGDGDGVWSWIHLDDAASATVLALSHDGPAIFNVVDDDPAPVREWLPALADMIGAKPPRHVPTWLARRLAGPADAAAAVQVGLSGEELFEQVRSEGCSVEPGMTENVARDLRFCARRSGRPAGLVRVVALVAPHRHRLPGAGAVSMGGDVCRG